MSDAKLDLEVVIEGTGAAARGLDGVADSSGRIGRAAGGVAPEVGKLSSAVNGLTRGASAANAAQSTMAQAMAGNFVGAFRSATVAVKGLWTAMLSNPLTAILAIVGAVVAGVVAYVSHVKAAAAEARKAYRETRDFEENVKRVRGTDAKSKNIAFITEAEGSGDVAGLERERANRAAEADRLETRAREAQRKASAMKNGNEKSEAEAEAQRIFDMFSATVEVLNEYDAAIARIKNKTAEPDGTVGAILGTTATANLTEFESPESDSSDDIRRAELELGRKKAIDKESDPVKKLQMQRKYLLEDSESESGVRRIAIEEKIYDLEKRITAERERQVEQAKDDAKARAESANAEADAAKAAAAERRAIEGHNKTEAFGGVQVPDGWKVVENSRRRTLAGGRAAQWFAGRNDERKALLGATHTTEMGRPDIGADGKTNPAERTNQLLEQVVERLA